MRYPRSRLIVGTAEQQRALEAASASALAGASALSELRSGAGVLEIVARFLGWVYEADALASNRWIYKCKPLLIDASHAAATTPSGDEFGKVTGILNLREIRNSATKVDGVTIPSGASIGPFGSEYVSGAWTTGSLEGFTEILLGRRSDGSLLAVFSEINPSRCAT